MTIPHVWAIITGVKNDNPSQKTLRTCSPGGHETPLRGLVEAGYSSTRPRQVISEAIASAREGLTPLEVLDRGRRQHARLGLGTVYRTLRILTRLNLVRRVHRADGCHGYLPASTGHHHVVVCQDCGRAAEFPGGDDLDVLIGQVEVRTGYRVSDHLLQLFGRCPECEQGAG